MTKPVGLNFMETVPAYVYQFALPIRSVKVTCHDELRFACGNLALRRALLRFWGGLTHLRSETVLPRTALSLFPLRSAEELRGLEGVRGLYALRVT